MTDPNCLDCRTSSRGTCPVHADSDSVDLEIARLKAELEASIRAGEQQFDAGVAYSGLVAKLRAESSRLTEEREIVRDLLSQAALGMELGINAHTSMVLDKLFVFLNVPLRSDSGTARVMKEQSERDRRAALSSRDNPPCGGSSCFLSDNGEWAHGSKSVGCHLSSGDSE